MLHASRTSARASSSSTARSCWHACSVRHGSAQIRSIPQIEICAPDRRFAAGSLCSLIPTRHVRVSATASTERPPALAPDAYICLGLAHCFEKTEEGKLVECMVIEPISASSLECMATGSRTSFKLATGTTVSTALAHDKSALPEEFRDAKFCEKFDFRCEAAARTWTRSHAMDNLMDIVPLGKLKGKFNFSLEDKRVLNFENVVTDDDNIKQDMSIDVYGRKKEEEEGAAAAPAMSAAEMKQAESDDVEDELDALLSG